MSPAYQHKQPMTRPTKQQIDDLPQNSLFGYIFKIYGPMGLAVVAVFYLYQDSRQDRSKLETLVESCVRVNEKLSSQMERHNEALPEMRASTKRIEDLLIGIKTAIGRN